MKTVTIPDNMSPWKCTINGTSYEYPPGKRMEVPDAVAAVISAYYARLKETEPTNWYPGKPVKQDEESTIPFTLGAAEGGLYVAFGQGKAKVKARLGTRMETYADVAAAVAAGQAAAFFDVGDQLNTTWQEPGGTAYVDPLDIVQLECSPELEDGQTVHGMMLQQHFTNVRGCPFDAQEALYDADEELPAGTYHFTVAGDTWLTSENGKVLQFTLTQPIPAGGQLVYADTEGYNKVLAGQKINTYSGPTSFVAVESVDLSEGSEGADLGTTDGTGHLNHHQRAFRGSGRWKTSMMRQYLNSAAAAGGWWTKQDKWDRASAFVNSCPGYMAGFPADFLATLRPVKVCTARDTVASDGGTDITFDTFFPISLQQLNAVPQAANVEGDALPYWKNVAAGCTNLDDSGRFKQYGVYPDLRVYGLNAQTTARSCWLRSAYRDNAYSVWGASVPGNVGYYGVPTGNYCAPACVITTNQPSAANTLAAQEECETNAST